MAVARVSVYHPDLDRTALVPVTAVPHMQEQGWHLAEPADQTEPASEGKPRAITSAKPTLGRPEKSDEPAGTGEPKNKKRS